MKSEFPRHKLNFRAMVKLSTLPLNFLKWDCLHTRFESPKLVAKETRLLLSYETRTSYNKCF